MVPTLKATMNYTRLAGIVQSIPRVKSASSLPATRRRPRRQLTFSLIAWKTVRMNAQLDQLKFDANGLIPIIVQDVENSQVLMMAWMNRQAVELTLQTGKIHTYSRSRGRLALKGESSRHFQHVREMLTDCDRDVLIFKCVQDVAACHEGYRSCFFRQFDPAGTEWKIIARKAFEPEKVYKK
jgi:phosphoribosyl-AMP cyclohydrolase